MNIMALGFKSDIIEIIDGSVSVRKLCENIGLIDLNSQYKKIQSDESFQSEFKEIEINGIIQKVLCIPYNKVDGWLFSISVNRVKPAVKQKLIEYKNECFDVLYKHFNSQPTEPAHAIPQDPTNLLIDLVKATQQQNEMMLQAINNQTTMFKSLQKQMLEVTKAVHYNSDVMYATQEAINMSQKKPSNPTYPTRVPHIVHPDMKPTKLTYMQKKTLDAAKELMRKKQYYEIVDGDEYYRIKGVELTDKLKKHPQYITLTLNTLAQNGYLKKVKLNHVCSVYALPKDQTEGKK